MIGTTIVMAGLAARIAAAKGRIAAAWGAFTVVAGIFGFVMGSALLRKLFHEDDGTGGPLLLAASLAPVGGALIWMVGVVLFLHFTDAVASVGGGRFPVHRMPRAGEDGVEGHLCLDAAGLRFEPAAGAPVVIAFAAIDVVRADGEALRVSSRDADGTTVTLLLMPSGEPDSREWRVSQCRALARRIAAARRT
jgi:hypothetical protein